MVTQANSRQVGGSHYKAPGKTEHWDIVAQHDLDYFQGQITKYVMRWKKKNGLQDLEKARHFLDKYIELQRSALDDEGGAEPEPHGYVCQDERSAPVARGQVPLPFPFEPSPIVPR